MNQYLRNFFQVKAIIFVLALAFFIFGSVSEVRAATEPIMIKDIDPGSGSSDPSGLTVFNGELYFSVYESVNGIELWKSDSTASGTVLVKDINPGGGHSFPGSLTVANGELYFSASDGVNGAELWQSDGTASGTVIVKDINPGSSGSGPYSLAVFNGELYFNAYNDTYGAEFWQSDGTASGTVMVKDIYSGVNGSGPNSFTVLNGELYFVADDGVNGAELWQSDGTATGTVMVKDIYSGVNGSGPNSFTVLNGELYFIADDGTNGAELWQSDGTATGTMLVKDINSGVNGSNINSLAVFNGELYFSASDGINGQKLWKSNGTDVGTAMVSPGSGGSPYSLTVVNDKLYFVDSDGDNGVELWQSDGTDVGTAIVKDINPGSSDSGPSYLTGFNGELYFSASDGVDGIELWKSDGTDVGTVMVKDIASGSSWPSSLTVVNGILYFKANDGIHGTELWKYHILTDTENVAAAQTAVAGISPWTAVNGVDTNIIDSIQTIVNASSTGVTVTISTTTPPANSQVAPDGTITYGSSTVIGDVTFTLTKNAATAEQSISVTIPDAVAPILTATSATNVATTTATLNFTTDEAGTYYYLVYLAPSGGMLGGFPGAAKVKAQGTAVTKGTGPISVGAKSVGITGLSAVTGYNAYVIVEDAAGNLSAVSKIPFTNVTLAYVDSNYNSGDAGGHTWGHDAFSTIKGGIEAVATGGTVYVNAGTYEEEIVINKTLTLEGDVGDEGVGPGLNAPTIHDTICNGSPINITANDVTVEGFILDAFCDSASIRAGNGIIGSNILDNEVLNNYTGIGLSPYSSSSIVMRNLIHDNTNNGIGIGGSQGNTISNNNIYDNGDVGIYFKCGNNDSVCDSSGTVVSNNDIYDNNNGVYFDAGDQGAPVTIGEGNIITGNTEGIYIDGNAGNFVIHGNSIYNNPGLKSGLHVENATFVDAARNWWGDISGPNVDGNGPGTSVDSETITTNTLGLVFYRPWCVDDACLALSTASSTPDDLIDLLTGGSFVLTGGVDPSNVTSVEAAEDVTLTLLDGSSVEIPTGTVISQEGGDPFSASDLSASEVDVSTLTGLGAGVTAEGALEWGIPNLHLEFNPAVTLHIYVSAALNGQTLHVKRSADGGVTWTSDGIVPPATCVVSGGICTFQATKASTYVSEKIASSGGTSGSGGGGGTCTSVVYDAWQSCVNGMQYRSILSQTPNNCTLTSAQQAERSKVCGTISETPETPSTSETPVTTITNLTNANSTVVNEVTAGEANTLITAASFANLSVTEKTTYLKIVALTTATLSQANQYTIADFIHDGTPTTAILGAGERAGSIASFQSAFNRLPATEADWQDVIKIANGRWPTQRSTTAEDRAKISFKKVYLRAANMSNSNDNAAVTVMAYGLRPALRNLNSEKAAIKSFIFIYKITPVSAANWDIVRAIAYSGATR